MVLTGMLEKFSVFPYAVCILARIFLVFTLNFYISLLGKFMQHYVVTIMCYTVS